MAEQVSRQNMGTNAGRDGRGESIADLVKDLRDEALDFRRHCDFLDRAASDQASLRPN